MLHAQHHMNSGCVVAITQGGTNHGTCDSITVRTNCILAQHSPSKRAAHALHDSRLVHTVHSLLLTQSNLTPLVGLINLNCQSSAYAQPNSQDLIALTRRYSNGTLHLPGVSSFFCIDCMQLCQVHSNLTNLACRAIWSVIFTSCIFSASRFR